jgi:hypothetical protein
MIVLSNNINNSNTNSSNNSKNNNLNNNSNNNNNNSSNGKSESESESESETDSLKVENIKVRKFIAPRRVISNANLSSPLLENVNETGLSIAATESIHHQDVSFCDSSSNPNSKVLNNAVQDQLLNQVQDKNENDDMTPILPPLLSTLTEGKKESTISMSLIKDNNPLHVQENNTLSIKPNNITDTTNYNQVNTYSKFVPPVRGHSSKSTMTPQVQSQENHLELNSGTLPIHSPSEPMPSSSKESPYEAGISLSKETRHKPNSSSSKESHTSRNEANVSSSKEVLNVDLADNDDELPPVPDRERREPLESGTKHQHVLQDAKGYHIQPLRTVPPAPPLPPATLHSETYIPLQETTDQHVAQGEQTGYPIQPFLSQPPPPLPPPADLRTETYIRPRKSNTILTSNTTNGAYPTPEFKPVSHGAAELKAVAYRNTGNRINETLNRLYNVNGGSHSNSNQVEEEEEEKDEEEAGAPKFQSPYETWRNEE